MTLNEILVGLQLGLKFRRCDWDEDIMYIFIPPKECTGYYSLLEKDSRFHLPSRMKSGLNAEDIMADDWEEVK